MLGHRLRRWPTISPTLVQRLVRLQGSGGTPTFHPIAMTTGLFRDTDLHVISYFLITSLSGSINPLTSRGPMATVAAFLCRYWHLCNELLKVKYVFGVRN